MRLIDADKLDEEAMYLFVAISGNPKQHTVVNECKSSFRRMIEEQPTVEAKEVVHGEWIYNEYYTWECGNCGFHPFKGFIPKEPGFNYCPNCGCDMREGNDVE